MANITDVDMGNFSVANIDHFKVRSWPVYWHPSIVVHGGLTEETVYLHLTIYIRFLSKITIGTTVIFVRQKKWP